MCGVLDICNYNLAISCVRITTFTALPSLQQSAVCWASNVSITYNEERGYIRKKFLKQDFCGVLQLSPLRDNPSLEKNDRKILLPLEIII